MLRKMCKDLSRAVPLKLIALWLITVFFCVLAFPSLTSAQDAGQIQKLTGKISPGEIVLYILPDLERGQMLYLHASALSGNLDPIIGITTGDVDPEALEEAYESVVERALAGGLDPLVLLDEIRNRSTLVWDDDSGGGLSSAIAFEVPADGNYRILAAGALSAVGGESFGDYQILIGINAPEVLTGEVTANSESIAQLDTESTPAGEGLDIVTGELTSEKTSTFYTLNTSKAGDTFYAYIETISGDLHPILVLENFARKPIRSANLSGVAQHANLQYTFPADSENFRLVINSSATDEGITSGTYRLLVGVNSPEVLDGQGELGGSDIIKEPIEVAIGVRIEQIVDVNQESEFFTTVATTQMEWTDPALAYNPEECSCDFLTFEDDEFNKFITERKARWPSFTYQNQQGNRWVQNRIVTLFPDGRARYAERFTTNFQVDFDFRKFPFDREEFFINTILILTEELYTYVDLAGFSDINPEHGEDEFDLTGFATEIDSVVGSDGLIHSGFKLIFAAPRHLSYYILNIFTPILLIVAVSWITFFLKDYGRRIEVASANLLLFIAFSWSLADNYPRLGYITFLDAIMLVMFVTNALVVVYNVWLKRLDMNGQAELADRVDSVLDWVYPISMLLMLVFIVWRFLYT